MPKSGRLSGESSQRSCPRRPESANVHLCHSLLIKPSRKTTSLRIKLPTTRSYRTTTLSSGLQ